MPNEHDAARWGAVTTAQREEVADARWRRWPVGVSVLPRRADADHAARRLAAELGAGHVIHQDGDVIIEDVEYRGRVDDAELARAEAAMGMRFHPAWRAFLQRPAWFHRGFSSPDAYVSLSTPAESAALVALFRDGGFDRPGMIPIGNDGAGEMLTVDGRDPSSVVTVTPSVSTGWGDSIVQSASIDELVEAIERGTFVFDFGAE